MIRYAIGLSVLVLSLAGCQDSDNSNVSYQSQARVKHTVSVVPVIDNTKNDYDWSLSDELTSTIYYRLSQSGALQLSPVPKVRAAVKKLKENQNPFGTDISWMKQSFPSEEFVVFLELIQHEEVLQLPRKKQVDPSSCPADLKMRMRVRVFDLRTQEPKVVLQEIVNDMHVIPRQFTRVNFTQAPWGEEGFSFSPLGLAHLEFTKEISTRIEDYILASKAHTLLN